MTIIVAASNGTEAWIGCDSAVGTDEYQTVIPEGSKIVHFNRLSIGVAGSLGVMNDVKFNLYEDIYSEWSTALSDIEEQQFAIKLIDDMVRAFVEKRYAENDYSLVYATPNMVAESSNAGDLYFANVVAAGSGYQYALGAMACMDLAGVAIGEQYLSNSLESTIRFSPSCIGPVYVKDVLNT